MLGWYAFFLICLIILGWLLFPAIVGFGTSISLLTGSNKTRPNTPQQYDLGRKFAEDFFKRSGVDNISIGALKGYAETQR